MSRSVLDTYLPLLEAFLERVLKNDVAMPATNDGKVNVAGLVAALGLPSHAAQHFFRKPELYEPVNRVAVDHAQLLPIGARSTGAVDQEAAEDDAARQAMKRLGGDNSALARDLLVAQKRIAFLEEKLRASEERLAVARETGMLIRT